MAPEWYQFAGCEGFPLCSQFIVSYIYGCSGCIMVFVFRGSMHLREYYVGRFDTVACFVRDGVGFLNRNQIMLGEGSLSHDFVHWPKISAPSWSKELMSCRIREQDGEVTINVGTTVAKPSPILSFLFPSNLHLRRLHQGGDITNNKNCTSTPFL